MTYPGPVVSADWLKDHLADPNVVIVDGTVHLADTGRNAKEEYAAAHIPGALFFDLDILADPDNPRPRKIPSRARFIDEVGKLGIAAGQHIVVYDVPGLYSAARVWWLFRQFGYDNVSVLDGGMVAWKAAGGALETGVVERSATVFASGESRDLLALAPDVLERSNAGQQIIDARTAGRWAGTETDRYPGARAGHIPNSLNLYWANLLDPQARTFLPDAEIDAKFREAGLDLDQPVTISCGSGLTACILALALHRLGRDDWQVYDGSWDEWGRNHDLPVAVKGEVQ
ncbi:3-mercaptopyruvate sulfurtransferase [Thioclava kandeliae]|uniref:3-mercaptopyruvate sulfurtransferase n=1 Tax=Thioclava kandeliae TaxID=3070818 RepID=A0ABV1SHJ0_9RHOB